MNLGLASLSTILAVAVFIDVRTRKVPNTLIIIGILSAFCFPTVLADANGLPLLGERINTLQKFGGITVGFAAFFPLYILRAMGAGDVKLMMVIGAYLGPVQTIGAALLTFVAGGVLAIIMTLWQRSFKQLVLNLRFMLTTSAVNATTGQGVRFEPLQNTAARMPYAVAIAAGTLLQLVLVRHGGWALS